MAVATPTRDRSSHRAGDTCSALLILLLTACVTTLSPTQRQQLETHVYVASYERTFAATRDAFVNAGYLIVDSDFNGGVIAVSTSVRRKQPNTALGLSVVAPFGDVYMERYGWAVFDTFLFFVSWIWAMPSNYMIARNSWDEVGGNVSFEQLGPERTRLRISFRDMSHDAKTYPVLIRRLQQEIDRQLFMKEGDTLGGEPQ